MEKLLTNKRVIVTGGNRGIGLAISTALAVDGAHVLLVGRTEKELSAAVERLRSSGAQADYLAADICAPGSAELVVEAALERLGGVDGLVNNAGVFVWRRFLDFAREDFERTLATNLAAPFYLSQAAARAMVAAEEGGSIVNIASIHGKVPDPNVVPHCATKFGLVGLTQAMAEALREHDIRVNAICPGAVQPDSMDRRSGSPQEKVTQADIATLTVYLISDLARSITGAGIDMPGSTRTTIKV